MKSMTMRQEDFYSWQYKNLINKTPKNNMKKSNKNMNKSKKKLKRHKFTTERN